eukprot:GSChrysophyteH1.ASY1.ANO1.1526.1 assembled CDS
MQGFLTKEEINHIMRENGIIEQEDLSLYCVTSNAAGNASPGVDDIHKLFEYLDRDESGGDLPNVVCVGVQEIVELSAANLLSSSASTLAAARWSRMCLQVLNSLIDMNSYIVVKEELMVGLFIVLFCSKTARPFLKHVTSGQLPRGVDLSAPGMAGNVMGNKGAVCIRCSIQDSTVCFVNSHLAAHRHHVKRRNEDYHGILYGGMFPDPYYEASILNEYRAHNLRYLNLRTMADEGHKLCVDDHDIVIWLGDLNYRVDECLSNEEVFSYIDADMTLELAENFDQLNLERNAGRAFEDFNEGLLSFPPSYKYIPGTNKYDRRKEKGNRCPAWCDRILWQGLMSVQLMHYGYIRSFSLSDHKPIDAMFHVKLRRVDWAQRERLLIDIMEYYGGTKDGFQDMQNRLYNDGTALVVADPTSLLMYSNNREQSVAFLEFSNTGRNDSVFVCWNESAFPDWITATYAEGASAGNATLLGEVSQSESEDTSEKRALLAPDESISIKVTTNNVAAMVEYASSVNDVPLLKLMEEESNEVCFLFCPTVRSLAGLEISRMFIPIVLGLRREPASNQPHQSGQIDTVSLLHKLNRLN